MDIIGAAALIAVGIVLAAVVYAVVTGRVGHRVRLSRTPDALRKLDGATRRRAPRAHGRARPPGRPSRPPRGRDRAGARGDRRDPPGARADARADLGAVGGARQAAAAQGDRGPGQARRGTPHPPDRGGDQARGRAAGPQHPLGVHATPRRGPCRRDDRVGRPALGRRHEGPDHRPRGPQHPGAGEPHRRRLHHRRHARARSSSRASTACAARSPA